jgi:hypothetical protein
VLLGTFLEISSKECGSMAETTETIAADLGKSPRQVINYKKAVERHIGGVITFQQGKQHFYSS